jgi:PAS domain S-box-containing protein
MIIGLMLRHTRTPRWVTRIASLFPGTPRSRQGDKQLEELLSFLDATVEGVADGILVVDGEGRTTHFNQRFARMWCLPESIGATGQRDPQALVLEQLRDPERFLQAARATLSQPDAESFDMLECKDGRVFERHSLPQQINGVTVGTVWSFHDVTEHRQVEELLKVSEVRFRRLFEAAHDGILILDANTGQITDVNPFLIDLLGYSREELTDKKLWEIGAFQNTEAAKSAFAELQRSGYARYEDLPLETKDGRPLDVEFVSNVYLVDHAKVIQCNIRDIAERKRILEQQVLMTRGLETLIQVISHDFKEPLRAIEGFSAILHDSYAEKLDERGHDFLRRIEKAAARLRLLLDDVVTLSKARLLELHKEEIDGSAVVGQALARLTIQIERTGARVRVANALPRLWVNETWAVEAVFNLLSNALKFSREGQAPEIEVAPYDSDASGPRNVGLIIRDRGPGVAPEHAERIFELFQRSVGGEIEGTGAGLAIVREVASRHGGRAWVRPREGGGAEFIITFRGRRAQRQ